MNSRFEKFSERARNVLSIAQDEAHRYNHQYIGTEHVLLGLLREQEGVAARILKSLDVDLNKTRVAIEFVQGRGVTHPQTEIGLTPRAKKVIELAVDEARKMDHKYIGTEHLLIGLLREGESVAAGILESFQVSVDNVREKCNYILAPKEEKSNSLRVTVYELVEKNGYKQTISDLIQILDELVKDV